MTEHVHSTTKSIIIEMVVKSILEWEHVIGNFKNSTEYAILSNPIL